MLQRLLTSRFPLGRYFSTVESKKWTKEALSSAVKKSKVVVFMKGSPASPQCGFSRAVIQILQMHGVPFEEIDHYDVLQDEELRAEMKVFSDWPTYPQVYFNGRFIGGFDILKQLHQNGQLQDELAKINKASPE